MNDNVNYLEFEQPEWKTALQISAVGIIFLSIIMFFIFSNLVFNISKMQIMSWFLLITGTSMLFISLFFHNTKKEVIIDNKIDTPREIIINEKLYLLSNAPTLEEKIIKTKEWLGWSVEAPVRRLGSSDSQNNTYTIPWDHDLIKSQWEIFVGSVETYTKNDFTERVQNTQAIKDISDASREQKEAFNELFLKQTPLEKLVILKKFQSKNNIIKAKDIEEIYLKLANDDNLNKIILLKSTYPTYYEELKNYPDLDKNINLILDNRSNLPLIPTYEINNFVHFFWSDHWKLIKNNTNIINDWRSLRSIFLKPLKEVDFLIKTNFIDSFINVSIEEFLNYLGDNLIFILTIYIDSLDNKHWIKILLDQNRLIQSLKQMKIKAEDLFNFFQSGGSSLIPLGNNIYNLIKNQNIDTLDILIQKGILNLILDVNNNQWFTDKLVLSNKIPLFFKNIDNLNKFIELIDKDKTNITKPIELKFINNQDVFLASVFNHNLKLRDIQNGEYPFSFESIIYNKNLYNFNDNIESFLKLKNKKLTKLLNKTFNLEHLDTLLKNLSEENIELFSNIAHPSVLFDLKIINNSYFQKFIRSNNLNKLLSLNKTQNYWPILVNNSEKLYNYFENNFDKDFLNSIQDQYSIYIPLVIDTGFTYNDLNKAIYKIQSNKFGLPLLNYWIASNEWDKDFGKEFQDYWNKLASNDNINTLEINWKILDYWFRKSKDNMLMYMKYIKILDIKIIEKFNDIFQWSDLKFLENKNVSIDLINEKLIELSSKELHESMHNINNFNKFITKFNPQSIKEAINFNGGFNQINNLLLTEIKYEFYPSLVAWITNWSKILPDNIDINKDNWEIYRKWLNRLKESNKTNKLEDNLSLEVISKWPYEDINLDLLDKVNNNELNTLQIIEQSNFNDVKYWVDNNFYLWNTLWSFFPHITHIIQDHNLLPLMSNLQNVKVNNFYTKKDISLQFIQAMLARSSIVDITQVLNIINGFSAINSFQLSRLIFFKPNQFLDINPIKINNYLNNNSSEINNLSIINDYLNFNLTDIINQDYINNLNPLTNLEIKKIIEWNLPINYIVFEKLNDFLSWVEESINKNLTSFSVDFIKNYFNTGIKLSDLQFIKEKVPVSIIENHIDKGIDWLKSFREIYSINLTNNYLNFLFTLEKVELDKLYPFNDEIKQNIFNNKTNISNIINEKSNDIISFYNKSKLLYNLTDTIHLTELFLPVSDYMNLDPLLINNNQQLVENVLINYSEIKNNLSNFSLNVNNQSLQYMKNNSWDINKNIINSNIPNVNSELIHLIKNNGHHTVNDVTLLNTLNNITEKNKLIDILKNKPFFDENTENIFNKLISDNKYITFFNSINLSGNEINNMINNHINEDGVSLVDVEQSLENLKIEILPQNFLNNSLKELSFYYIDQIMNTSNPERTKEFLKNKNPTWIKDLDNWQENIDLLLNKNIDTYTNVQNLSLSNLLKIKDLNSVRIQEIIDKNNNNWFENSTETLIESIFNLNINTDKIYEVPISVWESIVNNPNTENFLNNSTNLTNWINTSNIPNKGEIIDKILSESQLTATQITSLSLNQWAQFISNGTEISVVDSFIQNGNNMEILSLIPNELWSYLENTTYNNSKLINFLGNINDTNQFSNWISTDPILIEQFIDIINNYTIDPNLIMNYNLQKWKDLSGYINVNQTELVLQNANDDELINIINNTPTQKDNWRNVLDQNLINWIVNSASSNKIEIIELLSPDKFNKFSLDNLNILYTEGIRDNLNDINNANEATVMSYFSNPEFLDIQNLDNLLSMTTDLNKFFNWLNSSNLNTINDIYLDNLSNNIDDKIFDNFLNHNLSYLSQFTLETSLLNDIVSNISQIKMEEIPINYWNKFESIDVDIINKINNNDWDLWIQNRNDLFNGANKDSIIYKLLSSDINVNNILSLNLNLWEEFESKNKHYILDSVVNSTPKLSEEKIYAIKEYLLDITVYNNNENNFFNNKSASFLENYFNEYISSDLDTINHLINSNQDFSVRPITYWRNFDINSSTEANYYLNFKNEEYPVNLFTQNQWDQIYAENIDSSKLINFMNGSIDYNNTKNWTTNINADNISTFKNIIENSTTNTPDIIQYSLDFYKQFSNIKLIDSFITNKPLITDINKLPLVFWNELEKSNFNFNETKHINFINNIVDLNTWYGSHTLEKFNTLRTLIEKQIYDVNNYSIENWTRSLPYNNLINVLNLKVNENNFENFLNLNPTDEFINSWTQPIILKELIDKNINFLNYNPNTWEKLYTIGLDNAIILHESNIKENTVNLLDWNNLNFNTDLVVFLKYVEQNNKINWISSADTNELNTVLNNLLDKVSFSELLSQPVSNWYPFATNPNNYLNIINTLSPVEIDLYNLDVLSKITDYDFSGNIHTDLVNKAGFNTWYNNSSLDNTNKAKVLNNIFSNLTDVNFNIFNYSMETWLHMNNSLLGKDLIINNVPESNILLLNNDFSSFNKSIVKILNISNLANWLIPNSTNADLSSLAQSIYLLDNNLSTIEFFSMNEWSTNFVGINNHKLLNHLRNNNFSNLNKIQTLPLSSFTFDIYTNTDYLNYLNNVTLEWISDHSLNNIDWVNLLNYILINDIYGKLNNIYIFRNKFNELKILQSYFPNWEDIRSEIWNFALGISYNMTTQCNLINQLFNESPDFNTLTKINNYVKPYYNWDDFLSMINKTLGIHFVNYSIDSLFTATNYGLSNHLNNITRVKSYVESDSFINWYLDLYIINSSNRQTLVDQLAAVYDFNTIKNYPLGYFSIFGIDAILSPELLDLYNDTDSLKKPLLTNWYNLNIKNETDNINTLDDLANIYNLDSQSIQYYTLNFWEQLLDPAIYGFNIDTIKNQFVLYIPEENIKRLTPNIFKAGGNVTDYTAIINFLNNSNINYVNNVINWVNNSSLTDNEKFNILNNGQNKFIDSVISKYTLEEVQNYLTNETLLNYFVSNNLSIDQINSLDWNILFDNISNYNFVNDPNLITFLNIVNLNELTSNPQILNDISLFKDIYVKLDYTLFSLTTALSADPTSFNGKTIEEINIMLAIIPKDVYDQLSSENVIILNNQINDNPDAWNSFFDNIDLTDPIKSTLFANNIDAFINLVNDFTVTGAYSFNPQDPNYFDFNQLINQDFINYLNGSNYDYNAFSSLLSNNNLNYVTNNLTNLSDIYNASPKTLVNFVNVMESLDSTTMSYENWSQNLPTQILNFMEEHKIVLTRDLSFGTEYAPNTSYMDINNLNILGVDLFIPENLNIMKNNQTLINYSINYRSFYDLLLVDANLTKEEMIMMKDNFQTITGLSILDAFYDPVLPSGLFSLVAIIKFIGLNNFMNYLEQQSNPSQTISIFKNLYDLGFLTNIYNSNSSNQNKTFKILQLFTFEQWQSLPTYSVVFYENNYFSYDYFLDNINKDAFFYLLLSINTYEKRDILLSMGKPSLMTVEQFTDIMNNLCINSLNNQIDLSNNFNWPYNSITIDSIFKYFSDVTDLSLFTKYYFDFNYIKQISVNYHTSNYSYIFDKSRTSYLHPDKLLSLKDDIFLNVSGNANFTFNTMYSISKWLNSFTDITGLNNFSGKLSNMFDYIYNNLQGYLLNYNYGLYIKYIDINSFVNIMNFNPPGLKALNDAYIYAYGLLPMLEAQKIYIVDALKTLPYDKLMILFSVFRPTTSQIQIDFANFYNNNKNKLLSMNANTIGGTLLNNFNLNFVDRQNTFNNVTNNWSIETLNSLNNEQAVKGLTTLYQLHTASHSNILNFLNYVGMNYCVHLATKAGTDIDQLSKNFWLIKVFSQGNYLIANKNLYYTFGNLDVSILISLYPLNQANSTNDIIFYIIDTLENEQSFYNYYRSMSTSSLLYNFNSNGDYSQYYNGSKCVKLLGLTNTMNWFNQKFGLIGENVNSALQSNYATLNNIGYLSGIYSTILSFSSTERYNLTLIPFSDYYFWGENILFNNLINFKYILNNISLGSDINFFFRLYTTTINNSSLYYLINSNTMTDQLWVRGAIILYYAAKSAGVLGNFNSFMNRMINQNQLLFINRLGNLLVAGGNNQINLYSTVTQFIFLQTISEFDAWLISKGI